MSWVADSYRVDEHSSAPTGLPHRWIIKSFLPLSFILMMIATIPRLIQEYLLLVHGDRELQEANPVRVSMIKHLFKVQNAFDAENFRYHQGGLAIAATLISIILAASTGIIGASVVLLGVMSLPIMIRQKYLKPLALGTVAAAGCLGILIPPSIMLVIMGDQLGVSVGDLFMGAIFPGVILDILYLSYIL